MAITIDHGSNNITATSGSVTINGSLPSNGDVTTTGVQTLTNKTLTSPILNTPTLSQGSWNYPSITNGLISTSTFVDKSYTIAGTTPYINPNDGGLQLWTLTANSTPSANNWENGKSVTLMIDDGSAYTITWSSMSITWKTDSGSAPTLNTTGYTVIVLWQANGVIYGARVGNA